MACPNHRYTHRHDCVVYWTLKALLQILKARDVLTTNIQFGKALYHAEFINKSKSVKIEAGYKIITEWKIYHNKPDILIKFTNPDEIFIVEVAISHIQNYRMQEELKRTRYEKNSVEQVTETNMREIPRDFNLVGELERRYRCPVQLAVFVVGCFGEIIETEEHVQFCNMLKKKVQMNKKQIQTMMNKASYSVAIPTSNILIRRMDERG